MSKYKYYFRKPRSEVVRDVLSSLLTAGVIVVAATSPFFIVKFLRIIKRWRKYQSKKLSNAFYLLKKQKCIKIEKKNHQIYISLTETGKKRAGRLQIDALKIKRPKKWDKKWRIVVFDIAQLKKLYREALRGKLKQLNFYPIQKSVWVQPFNCCDEIEVLKEFFGLTDKEVRVIIGESIGKDSDFRRIFKLR